MGISIETSGSFKDTTSFLEYLRSEKMFAPMAIAGSRGVGALSRATPVDTGRAASSWYYDVEHKNGSHVVSWGNTDIEGGVNVVILIQYGHGTGTGGYVPPRDFINPAMASIFDELSDSVWREVIGHG
jgi:hypothetical protein